jgi:hypothetical protein
MNNIIIAEIAARTRTIKQNVPRIKIIIMIIIIASSIKKLPDVCWSSPLAGGWLTEKFLDGNWKSKGQQQPQQQQQHHQNNNNNNINIRFKSSSYSEFIQTTQ